MCTVMMGVLPLGDRDVPRGCDVLVCCRTLRGGTSWHQSATSHHHCRPLSVHDQLSSPLSRSSHSARTCLSDRPLIVDRPLPVANPACRSLPARPALARRVYQSSIRDRLARKKPVHIKKPLNAFMLFMKEVRSKVVDECTLKESAAINQILGRKVRRAAHGRKSRWGTERGDESPRIWSGGR